MFAVYCADSPAVHDCHPVTHRCSIYHHFGSSLWLFTGKFTCGFLNLWLITIDVSSFGDGNRNYATATDLFIGYSSSIISYVAFASLARVVPSETVTFLQY